MNIIILWNNTNSTLTHWLARPPHPPLKQLLARGNKSQDYSALSWWGGTIAKYSESRIVYIEIQPRLTGTQTLGLMRELTNSLITRVNSNSSGVDNKTLSALIAPHWEFTSPPCDGQSVNLWLFYSLSPFWSSHRCVFHTHHDDGNDQGGQTNQVELLREEVNQFNVTALGEVRRDAAREQR